MSYEVVTNPNRQEHAETEYLGTYPVKFSYFPERITLDWVGRLQAADELNDLVMLTNLISYVLADWDVVMGEGPFPPTSENLHAVPMGLILNIMEAMQGHHERVRKGPRVPGLQSFFKWFERKFDEQTAHLGERGK